MVHALLRLFVVGLCPLVLSACTATITTSPDAFPLAPGSVPTLQAKIPVAITNQHSAPVVIAIAPLVHCDLQQFSETAVVILKRELAGAGVPVTSGAARSMQLLVANPTWVQGEFGATGTVRLEAILGDGQKVVTFGEARSARGHQYTYNACITRAVENLLKEPALLAYLEGKS